MESLTPNQQLLLKRKLPKEYCIILGWVFLSFRYMNIVFPLFGNRVKDLKKMYNTKKDTVFKKVGTEMKNSPNSVRMSIIKIKELYKKVMNCERF